MAARKKKVVQPEAPPAVPEQQGPVCGKCGCTEVLTQLRKVTVEVGWPLTVIHAVSPCRVCTKCGNSTVTVNATIGDFAGLVPDPETVAVKQAEAQRQAAAQAPPIPPMDKAALVRTAKLDKAANDKAAKKLDKASKKKGTKKKRTIAQRAADERKIGRKRGGQ